MNKTIDCRGMACPLPVVNAKKATEELLNKPEVKELMKKLFGDGKNG